MTPAAILDRIDRELLSAARAAQSRVVLASPFLSIKVALELAQIARSSSARWTLYTRLDATAAAGGYLSRRGLEVLLDAGVSLRHMERLHAKVYLLDDSAFLGSANLTGAGLGDSPAANVELTVRIEGAALDELITTLDRWRSTSTEVGRSELDDLDARIHALPRRTPTTVDSRVPTSSLEAIPVLLDDLRERRLWVKAQYGEPDLEQWRGRHWFSSSKRGRPSFSPGDLVLIYSKLVHACYVIVEIESAAEYDPSYVVAQGRPFDEAERWPWVNLTVPRLVPSALILVSPAELGFTGQALQGGHKELDVPEFAAAVRLLAGVDPLG